MTFVAGKYERQLQQDNAGPAYDPLIHGEAGFGETYTASVSFVFDEETTVSSQLNMQGYKDRQAVAQKMVDEGYDLKPYQDEEGVIDYDRIAQETEYPGLKTDRQLYDERTQLLAKRRAYSQDVKDRGHGMAQFLGSMTGYMLDPINVATLPLGASASALRGMSIMARAGRVAAVEGVIGVTAETLIQPFIFAHKNEIGSPYSGADALMAIGTAAAGAAALGGVVSGAVGFFRQVAGLADELPLDVNTQSVREILNKIASDLEANPERGVVIENVGVQVRHYFKMSTEELSMNIVALKRLDELTTDQQIQLEAAEAVLSSRKGRHKKKIQAEIDEAIEREAAALIEEESARIPRGERKQLNAELKELKTKQNKLEPAEPEVIKKKGKSARAAKREAVSKVDAEVAAEKADLQLQIDAIESRLSATARAQQAKADMSRLEQGIYTPKLQEAINNIANKRLVEVDMNYLKRLDEVTRTLGETKASPQAYDIAQTTPVTRVDDFGAEDLAAYEALGSDGVIKVGDDLVNARTVIDEQSNIIDGLDDVRVCAIG